MSKVGWHLDEQQVKASGKPRYLWRAVDQAGETLDFYMTETRDRVAALAFLRRKLRGHHIPEDVADEAGFKR